MRSKGIPRWTLHRRQALLIPVFGKKMYDILANLCSLASPSTKTYSVCWVDDYFKEAVCSEEVCDLWTIPFLHFCTSRKFKHLRIHSSTLVTSNHMQLQYTFEGGSTGQIHLLSPQYSHSKRLLTEEWCKFQESCPDCSLARSSENDLAQLSQHGPSTNNVRKLNNASGDCHYKPPQKGNDKCAQDKALPLQVIIENSLRSFQGPTGHNKMDFSQAWDEARGDTEIL